MPTYAILGATGSMGFSILTLLLKTPNTKINVLVRSRSKLYKMLPEASSNPNLTIYEGSISDTATLTKCITHVTAVFLTVAVTQNIPGTTISHDTATAVVSSLRALKSQNPTSKFKPPRLIVLSSASVSPIFWSGIPSFVHATLFKAMYYVYTDLQRAEAYLRSQEDWLSACFVCPGGIAHDVQRGHALSASEQQTFISFLDVAAAMIELAEEGEGEGRGAWDMRHVGVVGSSGVKAKLPWGAPVDLVKGLVVYWVPWLYDYLP